MFNRITQFFTGWTNAPTAKIVPLMNGRFAVESNGQRVNTYARKRDAIRGATRQGLTVEGIRE